VEKDKAERALKIIYTVLGSIRIKYFICFGSLLHLIRDRTVEPDKDIDIGVLYEEYDPSMVISGMEKWEYKLVNRVVDDIRGKALYLQFEHQGRLKLPPIDIFAWYLHDKIRYHTYDTRQENKKVPKKYVFRGVPDKFLPRPYIHERKDEKLIKTFFGKWNDPYFKMEINAPLFYGSLLDIWYPNWLKPNNMQSASPWKIEMKSCKQWDDIKYIKEQLKLGKEEYQTLRDTLK